MARKAEPTVLSILEKALALIEDKKHWCQKVSAVDAEGFYTHPLSDDAVQWCAYGALLKAGGHWQPVPVAVGLADRLLESLLPEDETYVTINDGPRGHMRIVALYKRAIKKAKEEAACA